MNPELLQSWLDSEARRLQNNSLLEENECPGALFQVPVSEEDDVPWGDCNDFLESLLAKMQTMRQEQWFSTWNDSQVWNELWGSWVVQPDSRNELCPPVVWYWPQDLHHRLWVGDRLRFIRTPSLAGSGPPLVPGLPRDLQSRTWEHNWRLR